MDSLPLVASPRTLRAFSYAGARAPGRIDFRRNSQTRSAGAEGAMGLLRAGAPSDEPAGGHADGLGPGHDDVVQ